MIDDNKIALPRQSIGYVHGSLVDLGKFCVTIKPKINFAFEINGSNAGRLRMHLIKLKSENRNLKSEI